MPQKRKSRGRAKGGKGRSEVVQCSMCGSLVPKDKAKRVTSFSSLVDPTLARELKARGAFISGQRVVKYYCISCAIHHRVVKVRQRTLRRGY